MECKFKSVWWTSRTEHIKIETYWNVNLVGVGAASVGVAIKIETYWNVNAQAVVIKKGVATALK